MAEQTDKPKTKTIALSLYPADIAVIQDLSASKFMYNDSEAARFIIRHFDTCEVAQQEVGQLP